MTDVCKTVANWPLNLGNNECPVHDAVKIAFFDRSRNLSLRRLTDENLCSSATVVRVHDGALAQEYPVSSTTLVVVEI